MMTKKRIDVLIALIVVAGTLAVACVPRAARVTTGEDVAVMPAGPGTSDAAVITDRAPHATRTPMSLVLPAGGDGVGDAVLPTPTPDAAQTEPETVDAEPGSGDAADVVSPVGVAAVPSGDTSPAVVAGGAVALPRVEDVDPAPPFVVLVDNVRLVAGGTTYKVTGRFRNDGGEMYEGVGLEATFYDGSAWHFGPFDATVGCYTLAPGQSCAFSVEAYAREYTGYRLHPEGSQLKAWTGSSTALTVREDVAVDSVAGYVQLRGFVENQTGSMVNAVRVSAALLDGEGGVTGVGSMIVAGQLAPGAEAAFSLRVPADVYASYTVSAEGELQ